MKSTPAHHSFLVAALLTALATCLHAEASNRPGFDERIAEDWRRTLDEGDLQELMATYEATSALSDDEGEPIAERCREHADTLDAALITNPVGLGVWHAAYRCAEALNETGKADVRSARFAALVRHGFAARPDDNGVAPVRVLADADVWAFIQASGQELLFDHYDSYASSRHLVRVVGLWDEEEQRERVLHFDFLDSLVRLSRDQPGAGFPSYRRVLAEGLLKRFHELELGAATAGYELLLAARLPNQGERLDALERQAHEGSYVAALRLLQVCEQVPGADCGLRAVDALLPYVEIRLSDALVLLARAYLRGEIVPRDVKSAKALLDAADARLGDVGGRKKLASLSFRKADAANVWPVLSKPLKRAARGGDDVAAMLVAMNEVSTSRQGKPTARALAQLQRAAEGGLIQAQWLYGALLIDQKRLDEGHRWIERAAESDLVPAQRTLGTALMSGTDIKQDEARGLYWLERAGHGGSSEAMLAVADHYARQSGSEQSRKLEIEWVRSAHIAGDPQASLRLASVQLQRGNDKTANADAEGILRYLVGRPDLADKRVGKDARNLLASWLAHGIDTAESRKEAIALIQPLAEAGDSEFQGVLGGIHVHDSDPVVRRTGIAWLRKASDGGDMASTESLAFNTWLGRGGAPDPAAASQLWQRAVDAKYTPAYNNWAWVLCTSPDAGLRDAKRGLDLMRELQTLVQLDFGSNDTLAACHAADGNFDEASRVQQDVIAAAEAEGSEAEQLARLQARLALYQKGSIYTEVGPEPEP